MKSEDVSVYIPHVVFAVFHESLKKNDIVISYSITQLSLMYNAHIDGSYNSLIPK